MGRQWGRLVRKLMMNKSMGMGGWGATEGNDMAALDEWRRLHGILQNKQLPSVQKTNTKP